MSELKGMIASTPSTPFIIGYFSRIPSKPPSSKHPVSPPRRRGWTNLIKPVSEASPATSRLVQGFCASFSLSSIFAASYSLYRGSDGQHSLDSLSALRPIFLATMSRTTSPSGWKLKNDVVLRAIESTRVLKPQFLTSQAGCWTFFKLASLPFAFSTARRRQQISQLTWASVTCKL